MRIFEIDISNNIIAPILVALILTGLGWILKQLWHSVFIKESPEFHVFIDQQNLIIKNIGKTTAYNIKVKNYASSFYILHNDTVNCLGTNESATLSGYRSVGDTRGPITLEWTDRNEKKFNSKIYEKL